MVFGLCVLHLVFPRSCECFPRSTWVNCKIHAYSLTGFPPPANGLLHITQAATHRRDTPRRSSPHPSTISYSKHARQRPKLRRRRLPALHYIFGEENEPEQVWEQELHRPVQAPWPIGSDIGMTVLGSTIDIL